MAATTSKKRKRADIKLSDEKISEMIDLIHVNPCIYRKDLPEHRDIDYINNVWTSIACQLQIPEVTGRPLINGHLMDWFIHHGACEKLISLKYM